MATKKTPAQIRKIYIGKLGMSEEKFQKFFGGVVPESFYKKYR